jgi:imidazolonepropionase-like amidohydrolase
LGMDLGVIKTGAISDLILVSGNPLQNIANTRNIEGVLLGKKWMPREHLEAVRKNLEKSAPQSTAFLPK